MAWTSPRTWVTSELVTAAIMNTYIRDNQDYIKTEIDKIGDISQTDQTSSRALGTIYQNTSGKIMIVTVTVTIDPGTATQSNLTVLCDSGATPSTIVTRSGSAQVDETNKLSHHSVTFVVPPSYYYKAYNAGLGTVTLYKWFEWTIL